MVKRYAALVAQVVGCVMAAVSVGGWWRPEAGVRVAGVALVAGGAVSGTVTGRPERR